MKLFKPLLAGVATASLLFTSACSGSSSGSSTSSEGSSNKTVTVEYWHTYGEAEEEVLVNKVKPLFEEEHPNIKLKLTRMPVEGLKQQVIAGVSGGAAPDLMRMDIVWVSEFAKMGALKDVSAMDGFEEVKESVFEAPMSTNLYEGKYYGVPVNTNTKIAIYNKQLLEQAGMKEAPKTMEEFETVAKKAMENGAKGAIGMGGPGLAWSWLPYFWSMGGQLTNEDYTKFEGFLNSPESIQAMEKIVSWQKDKLLAPTALGKEPGTWDGMKNNEYLMIDDGPWFYDILMDEKGKFNPLEDTVRGLIPSGSDGSRSVIGGEDLVVFANSKNPEEAWTFAKWMLTEEPQKIMSETGLIPTNKIAANDPAFLKVPFIKEYVKQMETALPRTPIAEWSKVEEIINLNYEKALRGKMTVKEALTDAAKKADAAIAQ